MFCENETNNQRLFGGSNGTPYPKDGINDYLLHGADTVNPEHTGTKAALHYTVTVPPGGTRVIKVRLSACRTRRWTPTRRAWKQRRSTSHQPSMRWRRRGKRRLTSSTPR